MKTARPTLAAPRRRTGARGPRTLSIDIGGTGLKALVLDARWNPSRIYLGGGNARHLKLRLPPHVRITSNVAGLLGGIALWRKGGPA